MISLRRLREVLDYDLKTGIFRWRVTRKGPGCLGPGSVAGARRMDGYLWMMIDNERYKAHDLAWFFVTGRWPKKWVDHKNRKRDDNRFKNFRLATEQQNARNGGGWKRRGSKYKGVYPQKKSTKNPWFSAIRVNRKLIHLGSFPTQEAAHAAYVAAAAEHFGEFACAG